MESYLCYLSVLCVLCESSCFYDVVCECNYLVRVAK